jgi:hypothetical protein
MEDTIINGATEKTELIELNYVNNKAYNSKGKSIGTFKDADGCIIIRRDGFIKWIGLSDYRKADILHEFMKTHYPESFTKRRFGDLIKQRQAFFYVCKTKAKTLSLEMIGSFYGKDHSTVQQALKRLNGLIDVNQADGHRAYIEQLEDHLDRKIEEQFMKEQKEAAKEEAEKINI